MYEIITILENYKDEPTLPEDLRRVLDKLIPFLSSFETTRLEWADAHRELHAIEEEEEFINKRRN